MGWKILVVLITAGVAAAPAAQAGQQAMARGGCPQGYVAFDKQTGGGGAPTYRQGETVVASGVITNTAAGVSEVSLRWGTADGPELGRAAVDASGAWKGLAFAVPEGVGDGSDEVFYVARDRNGTMLPGLPYPFEIRVGVPSAADTATTSPATTAPAPAAAPKRRTQKARSAPIVRRQQARAPAPPRPAVTSASPAAAVRSPTASRPSWRPARAKAEQPARVRRAEKASRSDTPRTGRPAPSLRADLDSIAPGVRAPAPAEARRSIRDRDAATPDFVATVALALALTLLGACLSAFGAKLASGRRECVSVRLAPLRAGEPRADCLVEAELQRMLADHQTLAASAWAIQPEAVLVRAPGASDTNSP